MSTPPYQPELGQQLFGNAYGDHDPGEFRDYIVLHLRQLAVRLAEKQSLSGDDLLRAEHYGVEHVSDAFSMHPYYWGECTCGADAADQPHTDSCPVVRPNFLCGDLAIRWYKHMARGLSLGRSVTQAELRDIFTRCLSSIL